MGGNRPTLQSRSVRKIRFSPPSTCEYASVEFVLFYMCTPRIGVASWESLQGENLKKLEVLLTFWIPRKTIFKNPSGQSDELLRKQHHFTRSMTSDGTNRLTSLSSGTIWRAGMKTTPPQSMSRNNKTLIFFARRS